METTTSEGTFEYAGAKLYTRTWTPTGTIKAKLIFVHGYSEHINRYNAFFPMIVSHGIQVFAWDQRGWGRSVTKPAEKGLTGTTAQVVADIAAFIEDKLPSDVPVFVMGHSMGGGEILTLAGDPAYADLVSKVRGWLAECPFIGFTPEEQPSFMKVFVGRMVGRILPHRHLVQEVAAEIVTRDPEEAKSIRADALCHNTGTLEGLASMLDRTELLTSLAVKMDKQVRSMHFAHATVDRVCSFDKAMTWAKAQKMDDLTIKAYEGAYHQLHTDPLKEEYANDVAEWILKRSGNDKAAGAVEAKL